MGRKSGQKRKIKTKTRKLQSKTDLGRQILEGCRARSPPLPLSKLATLSMKAKVVSNVMLVWRFVWKVMKAADFWQHVMILLVRP